MESHPRASSNSKIAPPLITLYIRRLSLSLKSFPSASIPRVEHNHSLYLLPSSLIGVEHKEGGDYILPTSAKQFYSSLYPYKNEATPTIFANHRS